MKSQHLVKRQLHCVAGYFCKSVDYRVVRPAGRSDWLLILTLEGQGLFRNGGKYLYLNARDVMLIVPGLPQDYGLVEKGKPWSFLWAHFSPRDAWSRYLDLPEHETGALSFNFGEHSAFDKVKSALEEAVELFQAEIYQKTEKMMNALERAILWTWEANPKSGDERWDKRITLAIRHVMSHAHTRIKVEEVALRVGLSSSRFSHLFTEQVGCSFSAYLESVRMDKAQHLLASSALGVGEIAHLVGYEDPLYFSKRFKRAYGVGPRDFRRRSGIQSG